MKRAGLSQRSRAFVSTLALLGSVLSNGCSSQPNPSPDTASSSTTEARPSAPLDLSGLSPSAQAPAPVWPKSISPRRRAIAMSLIDEVLRDGPTAVNARMRLQGDPYAATWAGVTTMFGLDPLEGVECAAIGRLNRDLVAWTGALPLEPPDISPTILCTPPEVAREHLRVVLLWLRWLQSDMLQDERMFAHFVMARRPRSRGR